METPVNDKPEAGAPPEKPPVPPQAGSAEEAGGQVDVNAALAKVDIHPKFKPMYDAAVLSGMRIMFDKRSHSAALKHLEGEGPMADKIAAGIIGLVYLLWTKSNKTLPPQIIVPVAFTLTLKAFEFLQKSGDPEATKEVLGEATEKATGGVMQKFGVPPDQIQQVIAQQRAQGAPTDQAPKGLLAKGAP